MRRCAKRRADIATATDLDRALDRLDDAGEFGEDAVAGGVDDPAGMRRDACAEDQAGVLQGGHRRAFVVGHQPRVADDIGGENSGEFSPTFVSGHGDAKSPIFAR